MPRGCIIPGCNYSYSNTGHSQKPPKIHVFTVSTNTDILLSWQRAIDASTPPKQIVLKPKQRICEKHFDKKDVLSQRELRGPSGELLGISPYSRRQIRKGAVPSIFPWTVTNFEPEGTTHPSASGSPSSEKCKITAVTLSEDPSSVNQQETHQYLPTSHEDEVLEVAEDLQIIVKWPREHSTEEVNNNTPTKHKKTADSPQNSADAQDTNKKKLFSVASDDDSSWSFESLTEDNSVVLPAAWSKRVVLSREIKLVHFFTVSYYQESNILRTELSKEIIVQSDMQIQVRAAGQPVDTSQLTIPCLITSKQELNDLLAFTDGMSICSGCNISEDLKNFDSTVTYDVSRGQRRHIDCSLLSNAKQCRPCKTARKSLLRNKSRHSKQHAPSQ